MSPSSPDQDRFHRVSICRCGPRPFFLKGRAWTEGLEEVWADLPDFRDRHEALLDRDDLLVPLLHLRTDETWIRVYPCLPMNLEEFLRTRDGERLAGSTALGLIRGMAGALAALEADGILHRDLKPSNVLVRFGDDTREDPRAVLADFNDDVRGTRYWGAPESMRDDPDVTTPLFGLGLLAFELFSSRPFLAYLRDFAETRWPAWPGKDAVTNDLERYLTGEPSAFEDDLDHAPNNAWREGKRPPEKAMAWILAAVRHDPLERRRALEALHGTPVGEQARQRFAAASNGFLNS